MSRARKRELLSSGPIAWRIWRAYELGTRRGPDAHEVALYSDARFIDELRDLGPYTVFNTVSVRRPATGEMALTLVLRVEEYGNAYIPMHSPMEQATTGTYHGGWLADELAALISLAGGMRLEAGEITRRFRGARDRGVPTQWESRPPSPVVAPMSRPMLPGLARTVDLSQVRSLVSSYPILGAESATALVRAARQYQRALLIAELDPNAAWLQLVSAIEVAAAFHFTDEQDPWQVVVEGWPELARQLRPLREKRRRALAELLAPQVRAGARYRRFLRAFPPPAPHRRPTEHSRVKWSKSGLNKAYDTIYDHRSIALHTGIPFPLPLCAPPRRDDFGESDIVEERPLATGHGSFDAFWPSKKLPMHLHVFAYVVGHALRAWWVGLAGLNELRSPALRPGDPHVDS